MKKWAKKELKEFEKMILDKRDQVIKEYESSKERADELISNSSENIYSSHMADAGSEQQEKEKAYYWVSRENAFLGYLNRALEMIKDGTFGICKKCQELIGKERLHEVPHTTSCFECKSKVE